MIVIAIVVVMIIAVAVMKVKMCTTIQIRGKTKCSPIPAYLTNQEILGRPFMVLDLDFALSGGMGVVGPTLCFLSASCRSSVVLLCFPGSS